MGAVYALVLSAGHHAMHVQQLDGRQCATSRMSVNGVPAIVNNLFQNARGSAAVGAFTAAGATITNTDARVAISTSTKKPREPRHDLAGHHRQRLDGLHRLCRPAGRQRSTAISKAPAIGAKRSSSGLPIPPPPTTGGKSSSSCPTGPPCNEQPALWNAHGTVEQPVRQLHHQLQGDSELDRQYGAQSLPVAAPRRERSVLHRNSHRRPLVGLYLVATRIRKSRISDQRFWKEYIDFVIGVWQDPFGNIQTPGNPSCSYGPDFTCGSATAGANVSITGPDRAVRGRRPGSLQPITRCVRGTASGSGRRP